jgi:hypothetical protein
MQRKLGSERDDVQIPKVQRRGPPPTLAEIRAQARAQALDRAEERGQV